MIPDNGFLSPAFLSFLIQNNKVGLLYPLLKNIQGHDYNFIKPSPIP